MEREVVVGFFGPKCGSFCHMSLSRVNQAPWLEQVGSTGHGGPGEDPGPWKVSLVTLLNTHSRKGLRAGGRQQPVYPQYELVHAQPRAWSLGTRAWALIRAFQEPAPQAGQEW